MSMALIGGPLCQAYFLEFLCLLSTVIPEQAWNVPGSIIQLVKVPNHMSKAAWYVPPLTC